MQAWEAMMDSLSATIEQSQCSLLSQIPLEDAMKRKQMQAHLRLRFTAPGSAPSGPRQRGEGCNEDEQGLVSAERTGSGVAKLRITLLAAGFVIGPSGVSVRDITRSSGSDIRSWNEFASVRGKDRKVRTLVIEGSPNSVAHAVEIILLAVKRYKDLCEGAYCGQAVERSQVIGGVTFFYQPPPRHAVPFAAALRADSEGGGSTMPGLAPQAWAPGMDPHSPTLSASSDGNKENQAFGTPNHELAALASRILQGRFDCMPQQMDPPAICTPEAVPFQGLYQTMLANGGGWPSHQSLDSLSDTWSSKSNPPLREYMEPKQLDFFEESVSPAPVGGASLEQHIPEFPDVQEIIQGYQRHLSLQTALPSATELPQQPCPPGFSLFGPSSGYHGQHLASIFCPPSGSEPARQDIVPGSQAGIDHALTALAHQLHLGPVLPSFAPSFPLNPVIPTPGRAETSRFAAAL